MTGITLDETAPASRAGLQLAALIPEDVAIHRVQPSPAVPSWKFAPRIDGGFTNALEIQRLAVEALGHSPPSVVVASGPHFSSFVAAFFAAQRLGARLILDYRDEWTLSPFEFLDVGNADEAWERRCSAAADGVIFTTDSQLETHETRFPVKKHSKRLVIPNGWDPVDWETVEDKPNPEEQDSRISLAYFGYLGDHALPDRLLRDVSMAFQRTCADDLELTLRFVGKRSGIADRQLRGFDRQRALDLWDLLPRQEANRIMRNSTILLLISDDRLARYIPGKLYEYLASGRPILVFGEPGEASNLIERLGAGVRVAPGDIDGFVNAVRRLARCANHFKTRQRQEWLERHSRNRLARRLFDFLEQVSPSG